MDTKKITLKQFYQVLESHDWMYEHSNDYRTWTKGNEEYAAIRRVLQQERVDIRLFRELYNNWYRHVFFQDVKPNKPD